MWETIACLAGILGLLWVSFSRYRAGNRKAALFWLSVAITALLALLAINLFLAHPFVRYPFNSTAP